MRLSLLFALSIGCSAPSADDSSPVTDADADTDTDADADADADTDADADSDADTDTDPPEAATFTLLDAEGVSSLAADGRTALLFDENLGEFTAKLWTAEGGVESIGNLGYLNIPYGLSADGTSVAASMVANRTVSHPARWTRAGGWEAVGLDLTPYCMPDDVGHGYDISGDGSAMVGLVWDVCDARAFQWTAADGLTLLDRLANGNNRATAISSDGSTIVGFAQGDSDRTPAIWSRDGAGVVPNSRVIGELYAVNADGSMATGVIELEGLVWTPSEGITRLGRAEWATGGMDATEILALSDDGRILAGTAGYGWELTTRAFVWTESRGFVALADLLAEIGLVLPEEVAFVERVQTVSSDGLTLAGSVWTQDSVFQAYVLTLPPGTLD